MARLVYSMIMSLDGYVADESGGPVHPAQDALSARRQLGGRTAAPAVDT